MLRKLTIASLLVVAMSCSIAQADLVNGSFSGLSGKVQADNALPTTGPAPATDLDQGWFAESTNNIALADNVQWSTYGFSDGTERNIAQVWRDDYALTGTAQVAFDLVSLDMVNSDKETQPTQAWIRIQMWGTTATNTDPVAVGDQNALAESYTDLGTVDVEITSGAIQTYTADFDLGSGYEALAVRIKAQNDVPYNEVKYNASMEATIDNVTVTPEPATMTLLGLGGLAVLRRRKK
jgi:hypothetical protein